MRPGDVVRFRPGAELAQAFKVPDGAVGVVHSLFEHDGCEHANVMIEGFGFISGPAVAELEAAAPPRTADANE